MSVTDLCLSVTEEYLGRSTTIRQLQISRVFFEPISSRPRMFRLALFYDKKNHVHRDIWRDQVNGSDVKRSCLCHGGEEIRLINGLYELQ